MISCAPGAGKSCLRELGDTHWVIPTPHSVTPHSDTHSSSGKERSGPLARVLAQGCGDCTPCRTLT